MRRSGLFARHSAHKAPAQDNQALVATSNHELRRNLANLSNGLIFEQRLDRLEQLVLLIAQHVGVSPLSITEILEGSS